ncbi:GNAT family N-acetyltransferase [Mesorhizobium sp.]|uniref:GNAT family N-acetyltransferase n=1 Tax=Mesorhizobium sp. TaxID=1871066 RepID=UPI0025DED273|nr:GNAT family N-acetyltransferase [Mesorhizobium sp.]
MSRRSPSCAWPPSLKAPGGRSQRIWRDFAGLGGSPIGSCLFVRNEIDPAHDLTPWLAGLVVDEAYRGQGVGTALVRAIEGHAASAGVNRLYLYTWQARSFYEALGWTATEAFEQEGEPMLLMSCAL